MPDLEPWQVILIGCVVCNICTSCCCLLLSAGGGAAVSTNPALQAGILVTAMTPNAQNVYSYYSNITSNVSCLPLAANLAYISDLNGAKGIKSGSCPTGTTKIGAANGMTVCNPDSLYSNSLYTKSFNSWSSCLVGGTIDPRSIVWSSGQSLLSPETDLFTLKGTTFSKQPTGIPNTAALIAANPKVNYTFSMDIKLAGTRPDALIQVFYHNITTGNGRTPEFFILNNGWNSGYKGCPHVAHTAEISGEGWIAAPPNLPTPPVPDDVWTNVTVTASGSNVSMYINGSTTPIVTASAPSNHKLIWNPEADPANAWKWGGGNITAAGQMQIGNFYWWNTALSTSQIANLKIPSTPTPGVSTTSYYMPEPFSGTDIAGY